MARSGLIDCFDIDDCKARMITSDTEAGLVYGATHKVYGINEMQLEVVMTESESYGDGVVLDDFSRAKLVNVSTKEAWLTHAFLAAAMAGQQRQTGTSPNERLETAFGSRNFPKFELDFQCKYVGPIGSGSGDAHVIVHKNTITKMSYGLKMESRQEVAFETKGIPLLYQEAGWDFKRCWTFVENETSEVLTPAAADLTAPTLNSFTPTAAQTGVAVNTTLTFTFSEAMDPTSINEEHFLLATAAGVYVAFSTVVLSSSGLVATCTPASALSATTQYRWTVTRGVRDLAGNRMAANQTNVFTTV